MTKPKLKAKPRKSKVAPREPLKTAEVVKAFDLNFLDDMPKWIRDAQIAAGVVVQSFGTRGDNSPLPDRYLAAARALIAEAQRIHREGAA